MAVLAWPGAVGLTHVDWETHRCGPLRKRSDSKAAILPSPHVLGCFLILVVLFAIVYTIDYINKCIHLLLFSCSVVSDSL